MTLHPVLATWDFEGPGIFGESRELPEKGKLILLNSGRTTIKQFTVRADDATVNPVDWLIVNDTDIMGQREVLKKYLGISPCCNNSLHPDLDTDVRWRADLLALPDSLDDDSVRDIANLMARQVAEHPGMFCIAHPAEDTSLPEYIRTAR